MRIHDRLPNLPFDRKLDTRFSLFFSFSRRRRFSNDRCDGRTLALAFGFRSWWVVSRAHSTDNDYGCNQFPKNAAVKSVGTSQC